MVSASAQPLSELAKLTDLTEEITKNDKQELISCSNASDLYPIFCIMKYIIILSYDRE